ncbi:hypothetical protein [Streptomyces malaysiensis]|uniref:hypothetical protein n=1 Tax=Streptomyces malaysiensis TaxID=92644 RepID=UPI00371C27E9
MEQETGRRPLRDVRAGGDPDGVGLLMGGVTDMQGEITLPANLAMWTSSTYFDISFNSIPPIRGVAMGEHVHVRIWDGLAVSDGGDVIELSHCHCGATWSRTYRVDEGAPEE